MTLADLETVSQAAARLGVDRATVWRWIKDGVAVGGRRVKLAATRLGGRWVIARTAIEAFRAACNPTAAPLPENPAAALRRGLAAKAALAAELSGGAL